MSDVKHKEPSKQLNDSTSTPSKERVALNNNAKISFVIKASKDDGVNEVATRNLNNDGVNEEI